MYNKKVVMLIMDGWGIGKEDKYNAIKNAKTPNVDRLEREYPNVALRGDGPFVGLPEGQFGTSEINHLVIGTGQVVMQELPKIDKSIEDQTFFNNAALIEASKHVKDNKSKLHIVGILSDGKVHASLDHLIALLDFSKEQEIGNVYLHIFSDGRDAAPKSLQKYIKIVNDHIEKNKINANVATVQGRFFLDRDRDWEKTQTANDLMVIGQGMEVSDVEAAINFSYNQNNTDEFFDQFLIDKEGLISPNDAVIYFHYRTDRMFQIQKDLLDRKIENLKVVSFVKAFESKEILEAFPRPKIIHTLASTIAEAGKKQLHIAETEKYTHLTYFLNAGREEEFEGEEWQRLQSNRFVKPFYNFDPIMQADLITQQVVDAIENDKYDFIIVNYANTDMVGHTGNYEAAVIAAESVDYCVGKVYKAIQDRLDDYAMIVTADHGNSDIMWDYEADQPHTQHTTNPVPFILVTDINCKLDRKESLEDIAPTIFDLMGLEKPESMTGTSLIIEN